MGEAGQVVLTPGIGEVQPLFINRGLSFRKGDEKSTPYVYEVVLDAAQLLGRDWNATAEYAHDGPDPGGAGIVPEEVEEGANGRTRKRSERQIEISSGLETRENSQRSIRVAMSADSHAGHLRFNFEDCGDSAERLEPWVFIEASRRNWTGEVHVDPETREIYGYNTERQDYLLGPDRTSSFKGYFVSRFSEPFTKSGVTDGNTIFEGEMARTGKFTGAFVKFHRNVTAVEVRTGVSYVSVEQARRNLELETPDSASFEDTIHHTKNAWLEKLGR
jgi:putative alpha-1,2-mannosidase